jgi:predicted DNA-binding transcriptional regulator AlpA
MTTKAAKKAFEQPMPHELWKLRDAAEMCGLCTETLYRRIKRGELVAYGRPFRVRLNDVLVPHEVKKSEEVGGS